MSTRKDIALAEATANPIFLLQVRRIQVVNDSDYDYCGECEGFDDADNFETKDGLHEHVHGEDGGVTLKPRDILASDSESCITWWDTETVFLTREEAHAWATARAYRWPDGWRVYCVNAIGELGRVLAASDTPS